MVNLCQASLAPADLRPEPGSRDSPKWLGPPTDWNQDCSAGAAWFSSSSNQSLLERPAGSWARWQSLFRSTEAVSRLS
jgi:hypothetical protein